MAPFFLTNFRLFKMSTTIAAIATAQGKAGVGVIRLSGDKALEIANQICDKPIRVGAINYRYFVDNQGQQIDDGIVLAFKGPHSFTGEDVVELQAHGSPVVLNLLLKVCYELGANAAAPGEFSQRAFLNDKLDLAQAEAIIDLINAGTEQAARSARRSLEGDFSKQVDTLLTNLISLRMYVESALDFPDEEIDFLKDGQVEEKLIDLNHQLTVLHQAAEQGVIITQGADIVIVGAPNVGKSTLLNALANKDLAIVTSMAGTTRDLLQTNLQLDGIPLRVTDTAGIRDSEDLVEQEGIKRAKLASEKADLLVLMRDINDPSTHFIPDWIEPDINRPHIVVYNKLDLTPNSSSEAKNSTKNALYISLKTEQGLNELKHALKQRLGVTEGINDTFSARTRHVHALKVVTEHLQASLSVLRANSGGDLVAEELRLAQDGLANITGQFTSDDLLGEIFSNFCIGK